MKHIRYNIQGVTLGVFYEIENGDVHFDDVTFDGDSIFDVIEALRPDLWAEFEARILEEAV